MTEREKFEVWYSNDGDYPNALKKNADGYYILMQTAAAWSVWQARAAQDEWISADGKMPEDASWVLAVTDNGTERIVKQLFFDWSDDGEFYWLDGIGGEWCGEVTHWKPLPEGPKE